MSDRDFILANYNSFIDNVLLNQSPEFWSRCFANDPVSQVLDVYMKSRLAYAVRVWRHRLEAEQNKLPKGYNPYPKTTPDVEQPNRDEWWDAIDKDEKYQQELEAADRDGPKQ